MRSLLRHKAEVDTLNKNGICPLHEAVVRNRGVDTDFTGIIRSLLAHKANPNFITFNKIAFYSRGDINLSQFPSVCTEKDLIDHFGKTALMLASSKGQGDVVRILVAHKARVDLVNKQGHSALSLAQAHDNRDIVDYLTEQIKEQDRMKRHRRKATIL